MAIRGRYALQAIASNTTVATTYPLQKMYNARLAGLAKRLGGSLAGPGKRTKTRRLDF